MSTTAGPEPERRLDMGVLWRTALLQLIAVAVLSLALGLALPKSFFVDWGWLAGPASWMLCAALTATLLKLPLVPTLTGAVLAGLASLLFVLLALHWLGAIVAVGLFAVWCARLSDSRHRRAEPARPSRA